MATKKKKTAKPAPAFQPALPGVGACCDGTGLIQGRRCIAPGCSAFVQRELKSAAEVAARDEEKRMSDADKQRREEGKR